MLNSAKLESIIMHELETEGPDSGNGVCVECGFVQGGCEPDAEGYECEECGKLAVYGMEQALLCFLG